jgi:hypothetical protein
MKVDPGNPDEFVTWIVQMGSVAVLLTDMFSSLTP